MLYGINEPLNDYDAQTDLETPISQRKKRCWSKEEDTKLLELVQKYGATGWTQIAQYMPGRNGKQCHNR